VVQVGLALLEVVVVVVEVGMGLGMVVGVVGKGSSLVVVVGVGQHNTKEYRLGHTKVHMQLHRRIVCFRHRLSCRQGYFFYLS